MSDVTESDSIPPEALVEMESALALDSDGGPSTATVRVPAALGIAGSGPTTAPPPTPEELDRRFVSSLRRSGLLVELTDSLLDVYFASLDPTEDAAARQLDLLELYYAGADPEISTRRVHQDNLFLYRESDGGSARDILRALARVTPDVGDVRLERIGGEDGALVLRAGEHLSAVADSYEEELDTGEYDLRKLDDRPTVRVRDVVQSFNGLLNRFGVRERFLELQSDGQREFYVATRVAEALMLSNADCLNESDVDVVMEYAAW